MLLGKTWPLKIGNEVSFDVGNCHYSANLSLAGVLRFAKTGECCDEEMQIPVGDQEVHLATRPSFYDAPFLLKLKSKVKLSSRNEITLLTTVPIYFEIVLHLNRDTVLLDAIVDDRIPKAFQGAVIDGFVCNLHHSSVYSDIETIPPLENVAILSLKLFNKDTQTHDITKLLVRKEDLGLYEHETRLLTNNIEISLLPSQHIDVFYSGESIRKDAKALRPISEHKSSHALLGLLPRGTRRKLARYYGL